MCENGVSSTSTHCETDCWHTSPAAMNSQPASQPAGVRSIKNELVDDCDRRISDSFQPTNQPAGVNSVKAEPVDDCDRETSDSSQSVNQPAGVRSVKAEAADDSQTNDVSYQMQSADNTSREVKVDTKLKRCNCSDFPPSPPDTLRNVVKSEDCKPSKDSQVNIKSASSACTHFSSTLDPATAARGEAKREDGQSSVDHDDRPEMTADSIKAELADDRVGETGDVSHQIQSADNPTREVKVDTEFNRCNCSDEFLPSVKSEDSQPSKESKLGIKSDLCLSPAFPSTPQLSDPATTSSSEVKCEDSQPSVDHDRSEMTAVRQTTAHSSSDGQPSVDHDRSEMTADRQTTAHSSSDGQPSVDHDRSEMTADRQTTAHSSSDSQQSVDYDRSVMTADRQTVAHSSSDGQPSVDHDRSVMTADRQTTVHSSSDGAVTENISSSSVQLMTEKKGRPVSSSTDRTSLHTSAITAGPLVMLNRCHVCQRCCAAFVLVSSWKQHMASAHGEKMLPVSTESSTQSAISSRDQLRNRTAGCKQKKRNSTRTHQSLSSCHKLHKSNTSASPLPRIRSHVLQAALLVASTPGIISNKLDAKERVGNHSDGKHVQKERDCLEGGKTIKRKKDTVEGRKTVERAKVKIYTTDTDRIDLKKNSRRHVCDVCNKAFTQPVELKRHLIIHSGQKPFVCDVCSKAFAVASSLKTHLIIHSGEKPFICDVCSKAFTQAGNLKTHMRIHTGERPYKCPHCVADFKQSGPLQTHIRAVHVGDRPYVCQVCGAAFSHNCTLNDHRMIHTGEKPHACTVCGKRFAQSGNLRKHALVHSGKKPHACTVCGKRFTRSCTLIKHALVHSGKKPHACTVCGKRFALSHHLTRHALVHSGMKPYTCTVCGKQFTQSSDLTRHGKKPHSGKKPHPCPHCPAAFTRSWNLKVHVQKLHQ